MSEAEEITDWLIGQGCLALPAEDLIAGYGERLLAAGVGLVRMHASLRSLHPIWGAMGFIWTKDAPVLSQGYARSATPRANWVRSPFYKMMSSGEVEYLARLDDTADDFPIFDDLRSIGATAYLANVVSYKPDYAEHGDNPDRPSEGLILSWASDAPRGFSPADLALIRSTVPPLGLAMRYISARQTTSDVMATYLGADAGARVLSGAIMRGSLSRLDALIWNFDLRGFTSLSEQHPGDAIVDMLNDYFGAVVDLVETHGGNVLKFIGDGLIASFDLDRDMGPSAVDAAALLPGEMQRLNQDRRARGLPVAGFGLALHAGMTLYGNIGGKQRLDFTLIGPAVNEAARIQAKCRLLSREILISAEVARRFCGHRGDLCSLGLHALDGVEEKRELFTFAHC